jgi:hypothetical protein
VLTEDVLAKALIVYNHAYLPVPEMTTWKTGLSLPLPLEFEQGPNGTALTADLITPWAQNFDPAWTSLLDQKPAPMVVLSGGELAEAGTQFLRVNPTPEEQGRRLRAIALTNATEAEVIVGEVLRQLVPSAFQTALSFMDNLDEHGFRRLASQRAGLAIIDEVHSALATRPEAVASDHQARLQRAERMMSQIGAFSAETAARLERIYITEVPGTRCMGAIYRGLAGLYSPEFSASIAAQVRRDARALLEKTGRNTHHVERIMETMRARGRARPAITLRYDAEMDAWEPDLRSTTLRLTRSACSGWYFFGLSLHDGFHAVLLAVDNTDQKNPRIYWMDQCSIGFEENISYMLPRKMLSYKPRYGYSQSKLWQLVPAADTLLDLQLFAQNDEVCVAESADPIMN